MRETEITSNGDLQRIRSMSTPDEANTGKIEGQTYDPDVVQMAGLPKVFPVEFVLKHKFQGELQNAGIVHSFVNFVEMRSQIYILHM